MGMLIAIIWCGDDWWNEVTMDVDGRINCCVKFANFVWVLGAQLKVEGYKGDELQNVYIDFLLVLFSWKVLEGRKEMEGDQCLWQFALPFINFITLYLQLGPGCDKWKFDSGLNSGPNISEIGWLKYIIHHRATMLFFSHAKQIICYFRISLHKYRTNTFSPVILKSSISLNLSHMVLMIIAILCRLFSVHRHTRAVSRAMSMCLNRAFII